MKSALRGPSKIFYAMIAAVMAGCFSFSPALAGLKGVGGIEAEPPADKEYGNVLVNPGFEEGLTGWKAGKCFFLDSSVAHSGRSSVMMEFSSECGSARQLGLKLGTANFAVRGWIKTESFTGKPRISVFDSTHGTFSVMTRAGEGGTNEWKRFEAEDNHVLDGHLEDNLEYRLHAVGSAAGSKAWFDDLELVPKASLLSVFIRYPNYRGYLWDDGHQLVKGDIEVNTAYTGLSLGNLEAEIMILDALSGRALDTIVLRDLKGTNQFSWNAADVPVDGEVLVRASIRIKGGGIKAQYPDYRIVKKSAAYRASLNNWIDEKNILHHSGAPRFVWGVYDRMSTYRCQRCIGSNVAYYEAIPGFNGLSTLDNYADTKANTVLYFAPFAAANPGVGSSADEINPWAAALRSRGAAHLHIVNHYHRTSRYYPYWAKGLTDEELWREAGSKINDKGFLGYYTADEPDLTGSPTLSELFRQYEVLKETNRDSITYTVLSKPAPVRKWRDAADVMGVDVYPIGGGPLTDDYMSGDTSAPYFKRVDLWTEEAVRSVKGSRPVWMVLQLFTFGGKFPEYADMKKMALKSIISGARGILWWGFVSSAGIESKWYGGYQSPCSPQPCDANAYSDYKRLSEEIMGLEAVLLSDDIEGIVSCSDKRIKFIVKRAGQEIFVIATNTADENISGVTFTLNAPASSEVEVYAESRKITPEGRGWTDGFTNYDGHIYRVFAPQPATSSAAPVERYEDIAP